jgi:DNA-binding LacI/PurR family transcriptional regulator
VAPLPHSQFPLATVRHHWGWAPRVIARYASPPLTTVAQPIRQLGSEMAKMLVSLIGGELAGPLILPTRLIIRESSGPRVV